MKYCAAAIIYRTGLSIPSALFRFARRQRCLAISRVQIHSHCRFNRVDNRQRSRHPTPPIIGRFPLSFLSVPTTFSIALDPRASAWASSMIDSNIAYEKQGQMGYESWLSPFSVTGGFFPSRESCWKGSGGTETLRMCVAHRTTNE